MLPADAIIRAATRWLKILASSSVSQSWTLIRSDPSYTDFSQTQYVLALDWLRSLALVNDHPNDRGLSSAIANLPEPQRHQVLFERAVERSGAAWLPDADLLMYNEADLPQDAVRLAASLQVSERRAFDSIQHVHGRLDLAHRNKVGRAGELALIDFLESKWPGSTVHVAATSDGFGYDIQFSHSGTPWYLEVKSTTRRGRLTFYLSRHEHEVGLREPNWRLVVVGLGDELRLRAVATVRHLRVLGRAPKDAYSEAKWQSTSHDLTPEDLDSGLAFIGVNFVESYVGGSHSPRTDDPSTKFAWLPL